LAADFSKCQDSGFAAPLAKALKDLDVGVLVNNVGMSYPYPLYFAEDDSTPELHSDLVKLNVTSTTLMTKIVLPGFHSIPPALSLFDLGFFFFFFFFFFYVGSPLLSPAYRAPHRNI